MVCDLSCKLDSVLIGPERAWRRERSRGTKKGKVVLDPESRLRVRWCSTDVQPLTFLPKLTLSL